jgi:hypothetical protein
VFLGPWRGRVRRMLRRLARRPCPNVLLVRRTQQTQFNLYDATVPFAKVHFLVDVLEIG